MPIIEDGRDETDPLTQLALTQYLMPMIQKKPDVLVLGCTHYPVFKRSIARMMGPTCQVIDSAKQCAEDVTARLDAAGMLSPGPERGTLRCFVTDGPEKFQSLATRFLGEPIDLPTCVTIEELTAPPVMRLERRQAV